MNTGSPLSLAVQEAFAFGVQSLFIGREIVSLP
jgi:hypothetical protein